MMLGHGGARPGAGRKPTDGPVKKQRKIVATEDIQEAAVAAGKSISQYLIDLHEAAKGHVCNIR